MLKKVAGPSACAKGTAKVQHFHNELHSTQTTQVIGVIYAVRIVYTKACDNSDIQR